MQELTADSMVGAVSEALETVAFMMAMPPEEELPAPSDNILASVQFNGPVSGTIEILAPLEFVHTMAANIMGLDTYEDEIQDDKAEDAFKELLNITCGILVEQLASSPTDMFNIGIPRVKNNLKLNDWNEFVNTGETTVLDVDGLCVAVKFTINPSD